MGKTGISAENREQVFALDRYVSDVMALKHRHTEARKRLEAIFFADVEEDRQFVERILRLLHRQEERRGVGSHE